MSEMTVSVKHGNDGGRQYFVDPKPGAYNAVLVDIIDHGYSRNSFGKVARKIQPAFQLENTITEKMILLAKKAKGLPEVIEEADQELIGKRLFVRGKKMTLSLFPGGENMKASDLYNFLSDITGEPLPKGTKAQPYSVDPQTFIGTPVTIIIARNTDKNDPTKVYTNVAAVSPFDADEYDAPISPDENYVRVKDREGYTPPPSEADVAGDLPAASSAPATGAAAESDAEIPWDNAEKAAA
jgi:hypothetical protein